MKTTPTPGKCSECGYEFEASSSAFGEATPSDNDLSICIGCGAVLVFENGLKMRNLTSKEIAALPADVRGQLVAVQAGLEIVKRTGGE